jgi:prepilin-type N-terminal cleavage/methylation domain-containing protein
MMTPPRISPQSGFSLLEVIVAFLVFALIASVVLAIVSRGLVGAEQTARYQHATMLAESLLDRAATEIPEPGSRLQGESDGGLRWTLRVDLEPGFDGPHMRLLRAEALVEFDGNRRVFLQTLVPGRS